MKRGFTLLELIIVIVVIGLLASIGVTEYFKVVERSRGSEAKSVLGSIRTAQEVYKLDHDVYTATLTDLPLSGVPTSCVGTHYYQYLAAITGSGDTATFIATATRCKSGGKEPQGRSDYTITLNEKGAWGGSPPF